MARSSKGAGILRSSELSLRAVIQRAGFFPCCCLDFLFEAEQLAAFSCSLPGFLGLLCAPFPVPGALQDGRWLVAQLLGQGGLAQSHGGSAGVPLASRCDCQVMSSQGYAYYLHPSG